MRAAGRRGGRLTRQRSTIQLLVSSETRPGTRCEDSRSKKLLGWWYGSVAGRRCRALLGRRQEPFGARRKRVGWRGSSCFSQRPLALLCSASTSSGEDSPLRALASDQTLLREGLLPHANTANPKDGRRAQPELDRVIDRRRRVPFSLPTSRQPNGADQLFPGSGVSPRSTQGAREGSRSQYWAAVASSILRRHRRVGTARCESALGTSDLATRLADLCAPSFSSPSSSASAVDIVRIEPLQKAVG